MNTAGTINIRSIQHYLYCPHRWGLMEIDDAWAENYFVVRGNLLHERVHTEGHYISRGREVFSSLRVWNDLSEYDIFGVIDCLEQSEKGFCIVEYKPTKPKDRDFRTEDALQVFAQKLCVDFVLGSSCRAEIYYADVRKRYALPFRESFAEYDMLLKSTLSQMRKYLAQGKIPPVRKAQYCGGCSFKDICMPKIKCKSSLRQRVAEMAEVDICGNC